MSSALLSTVPIPFWPVVWRYVAIVTFYVANWACLLGSQLGIFAHTWSLAIQEQFYLVWPLAILFLLRSFRSRSTIMLLLLCATCASLFWRFQVALGTHTIDRVYWASAGAAVVLVSLLVLTSLGPAFAYGVTSIVGLATAMMIVDVLSDTSWLALVLGQPWLRWTGRISYGLYLWHFPVFFHFGVLRLGPSQDISYERVVLAWIVTCATSTASYLLIERPALPLKSRFAWHQNLAAAVTCPSSPESHR